MIVQRGFSTRPARSPAVALALTSLAASGIHFAVMADHFAEAFVFGLFFAVVAWAQALWAVAVVVAPVRIVLTSGIIGNLAVIAVWAMSRTVGVPLGPEPWTPESIGPADLLCGVLEGAIVLGCVLLLRHDMADATPDQDRRAVVALPALLAFGVALAVGTSVAIAASPEHEHAEAGHSHAAEHTASSHDGHVLVGGNGEPDLTQIAVIRHAMRKYLDVRDARAAGWEQEHRDWPELGAHFARNSDWDGSFPARPGLRIRQPEFLMYSRYLTGHWKLVAVAYVFDQALYPQPPKGLVGAQYHQHAWNCIKNGDELEEEDWGVLSREECKIMRGVWSPGGVWMTHVWLVGNPDGIFAATNPRLTKLR
jgi:hypothetical protein